MTENEADQDSKREHEANPGPFVLLRTLTSLGLSYYYVHNQEEKNL